jgi:hypothetical protein
MLHLTDKLPKPNYDDIEVEIDDKKFTYRAVSESPKFGGSKELSINQFSSPESMRYSKKRPKKLSRKSIRSKVSDTVEGSEPPSVRSKPSPYKSEGISSLRKNKKPIIPIENLPVVMKPSNIDLNKMASVQRIANRVEQEIKNKPLMNIDREYSNLQKILDKQKVYEKETANVRIII